jgi:hypothetical protein
VSYRFRFRAISHDAIIAGKAIEESVDLAYPISGS